MDLKERAGWTVIACRAGTTADGKALPIIIPADLI
jgi:hypothetical protein